MAWDEMTLDKKAPALKKWLERIDVAIQTIGSQMAGLNAYLREAEEKVRAGTAPPPKP